MIVAWGVSVHVRRSSRPPSRPAGCTLATPYATPSRSMVQRWSTAPRFHRPARARIEVCACMAARSLAACGVARSLMASAAPRSPLPRLLLEYRSDGQFPALSANSHACRPSGPSLSVSIAIKRQHPSRRAQLCGAVAASRGAPAPNDTPLAPRHPPQSAHVRPFGWLRGLVLRCTRAWLPLARR